MTDNDRMKQIVEAIAVTAELTDTTLSAGAIATMTRDLMRYPQDAILYALTRCRRELTHRLTGAALIDRLEQSDVRPHADEAWSLAVTAYDEDNTVVWTEEMAAAYGIALPLLNGGDDIGARMAFRAAYQRMTDSARQDGKPAKWLPSLGRDPDLRTAVLEQAVERGLLTQAHVAGLLPAPATTDNPVATLLRLVADNGHRIDKIPDSAPFQLPRTTGGKAA
jgi:hypothetical protein